MRPYVPRSDLEWAIAQRDRWIRLFNRLDAAVSRHRTATGEGFTDEADEALHAAHDKILKSAARGRPHRD